MKTVRVVVLILSVALSQMLNAQCDAPTNLSATYCDGESATISITDADPNVDYAWYTAPGDNIPSYGTDGKGREFVSPGTQTAPNTFWYVKETTTTIGPAYRANTGGTAIVNDGVDHYQMTLDASVNIKVESYTVIVRMDDPSETYRFGTRFIEGGTTDTTYAAWMTGVPSDFTALGSNFYAVEVPVDNITIPIGTGHIMEFISGDDTDGIGVDAIYWFANGAFTGNNYASGSVVMDNPAKTANGSTQTPLMMDWNVVLQCDREPVTTTLSNACCTPVGDDFSITASTYTPVGSDFPLTLTASGVDINSSMYYYWYDVDGNPLADGLNVSTYDATQIGTYTVRVVNDPADIGAVACYGNRSVLLGIRNIFAPNDTTICIGDPISLKGEGAEGGYRWYSNDPVADAAIVTPNAQETDVNFTDEGVYTMIVEGEVKLGNIAYDGKFENFNDASNFDATMSDLNFETTYGISGGVVGGQQGHFITGPGELRVDDELRAWCETCTDFCTNNPDYWTKTDPGTGDVVSRGNIFYADAHDGKPETAFTTNYAVTNYLWQQSNKPVEPNQTYEFSMDISEWNQNAAPTIMLLVNGQPLDLWVDGVNMGTMYSPPSGATNGCEWKTVIGYWDSGANTSATITVSEVTNDLQGFEFAMDDITFSTGRGLQTDEVVVTVNDCSVLEVRDDTTICAGDPLPLYLKQNNGFLVDWRDQDDNVVATDETASIYITSNNEFTATAKYPIMSLLANGNFESDVALDFTTVLTEQTNNQLYGGQYWVSSGGDNVIASTNGTLTNEPDHTTGTLDGKMMMFWFDQNNPSSVFEKTIAVTNGMEYGFSLWTKYFYDNSGNNAMDYSYEIQIDNVVVESGTIAAGQDWTNLGYNWTATVSGTATVEFVIIPPSGIPYQTAFLAMDDIVLSMLGREKTDRVIVNVDVCNTLTLSDDCVNGEREVYYETDGIFMGWYDDTDALITTEDTLILTGITTDQTVTAKIGVSTGAVNENGNMNDGTTGLNMVGSQQTTQIYPNGDYLFTTDASTIGGSSGFVGLTSAEGDGGQLLIYHPQAGSDATIYRTQGIAVDAGTTYALDFSVAYLKDATYLSNVTELYPVRLLIDGVEVATYDLAEISTWQEFSYSFTPTVSTTSVFELRVEKYNNYGETSQLAYGIDAVNLNPVTEVMSSSITVEPCTPPCNQPTAIDITALPAVICSGDDVTLQATYDDGGITPLTGMAYVWYEQGTTPVPGDYTAISGTGTVNVPDEVVAGVTTDQTWVLRVEDGTAGDVNCLFEESIDWTLTTTTAITTQPTLADPALCPGEDFTLTVAADGANLSYQWMNGAAPVGTDSPTLTVTGVAAADAGTYTVEVTGDCGSETSNGVAITVGTATAITTQPTLADPELCEGEDFTLTVAADGDNLSYQWLNGTTPVGTDSPTLTVTGVTAADAGTYTVEVSGDCGDVTSTGVAITVLPTTTITTQPTLADPALCPGEDFTLTVAADGANLSYQWMNGAAPVGTDSPTLTVTGVAAADAGTYTVEVIGDCGSETSTGVAITVGTATAITTQPTLADPELCEGEDFTLTVAADGDNLSYQWLNGTTPVGTDSPTLTVTGVSAADAGTYTVEVIGDCGTETSTGVAITVVPTTTITTQPTLADPDLCPGEDFTLTVAANGANLSYQWLNGAAPLGTDSPSLTVTGVAAADAGSYTVVVSGDCGNVTSSAVVINVGTATTINTDPTDVSTCAGSNVTFNVGATGDNLTYQWQKDGADVTVGTGGITDTYSINGVALADQGNYTVIVTGDCGVETSAVAALTITATEFPSVSIADFSPICEGDDATITITTSNGGGSAPQFSYFYGDGTPITGAQNVTTLTHTLTGVTANTDVYVEMLSNSTCIDGGATNPATSTTKTIAVDPAPTTANAGSPETICTADYQLAGNTPTNGTGIWVADNGSVTFDDASLPNATASGIPNGTTVTFTWEISSGVCPPSSSDVAITRAGQLTSPDAGNPQTICEGEDATLTGNAPGVGETGTWTGPGTINSPTSATTTVSGLPAGSHTFTYTMDNGFCPTSDDQVIVTVDPLPTASNAGTPETICTAGYQLSANVPTNGTGMWTADDINVTFDDPSLPNATANGIQDGTTVTFTWEITSGVCLPSSSDVAITRAGALTTPVAGSPQTICEGSDVTLTGNAPGVGETGTWSGPGTIVSPNSATTDVTGLPVGVHIFTYTMANGFCNPAEATVDVTVQATPIADITDPATAEKSVNTTTTTLVAATPAVGFTGTWVGPTAAPGTGGISSGADLNDPTSLPISELQTDVPVQICWEVEDDAGVCTVASECVNVIKRDLTACAGSNAVICETDIASFGNLTDAAPNVGIGETGAWTGDAFTVTANTEEITPTLSGPGTYKYTYTIENPTLPGPPTTSCVHEVVVEAAPTTANAGTPETICTAGYELSGNTPAVGTGMWTADDLSITFDDPTLPNATATGIQDGTTVTFTWTISNGVCAPSTNTVAITRAGALTTPQAGSDQEICFGEDATLTGNTPAVGETGTWSGSSGTINSPTTAITTVSGLPVGTHTFTYTMANGFCNPASATVDVIVNETPDATIAGTATICDDGSDTPVTLSATAGTGPWTVNYTYDDGTSVTPMSETVPISGTVVFNTSNDGDYTLTSVNDAEGCNNSLSASITIDKTDLPDVSNITSNTATCPALVATETFTANLDAGAGPATSYNWVVTNGTIISGQGSNTITVDFSGQTGAQTIEVVPVGCNDGAARTTMITVEQINDPSVSIDPINTLCFDADEKTFTAEIANAVTPSVSWSLDGTFIGNGTNTATGNTINTFDYYNGATLRVDVTTGNTCTTTPDVFAEVVLSVKDPAPKQVPSISSTNFCNEDGPIPMSQGTFVGDPSLQYSKVWYVNKGFGPEVAGVNTSTIQVNESGTYWLEVSHNICPSATKSEEVTVVVDQMPAVEAGPSVVVEEGDYGTLEGSVLGLTTSTYWSEYLEGMDMGSPFTTFYGTTTGETRRVTMVLTAENGTCSNSDFTTVIIRPDIYIPKVFTPNDDKQNDLWEIPNIDGYPEAKVRIFNRWGNEVWRNDKPYVDEPWDGKRGGTPMPIATYYYIIEFDGSEKEPIQGSVTILR